MSDQRVLTDQDWIVILVVDLELGDHDVRSVEDELIVCQSITIILMQYLFGNPGLDAFVERHI